MSLNARVFDDPAAVARAAAQLVTSALEGGAGSLVLAGGSTPKAAYQLLRPGPVWGRVSVLFGDERCVAPDDPESNYAMAQQTLLARVGPATVFRMPGELGAEEAARRYDEVLQRVGRLDLVLLGMGPDGHTASLAPGYREDAGSSALAIPVHDFPKPPPDRVSLTLRALRSARRVVFVVTGEDKADAVLLASEGRVPSGQIDGAEYLLDRAAAAKLPA
ncbi:MAG: 6-phosphogluconolactonase [Candidatus Dormibacteraeota bacterium]|nr:6-phosphogluconolactonase [Candidatus Dormibacteraeota bacterium]